MLSSMMRHQFGKGAGENRLMLSSMMQFLVGKTCSKISGKKSRPQNMLSSMMRHQFVKGGAGENFGKTCSVA